MRVSVAVAAGIMLLSLLLLQGCGRKGPLYLPKVKAGDQSASRDGSQAVPQPAPSAPGR